LRSARARSSIARRSISLLVTIGQNNATLLALSNHGAVRMRADSARFRSLSASAGMALRRERMRFRIKRLART
jgi:hypothetical protein